MAKKRRGNGEGTISRRKDGYWVGQYTAQTANGPKLRYIYGKKRVEVARNLAKAIADRDGGLAFDAENLTLGKFLERWLSDSVRGGVKPVTYESYARLVRKHVTPALGRVKLDKLSPAHLQGLYRSKLDRGLSPRTVQYLHVVLHRALKQALRWGLVPRNVSEAVDPPKVHREEMRPLSADQVRVFLKAAHEDRLEALYILAIHCGLRQGELLALKWEDVNLEDGILQVRRTLSGGEFTAPKTAKSRRFSRGPICLIASSFFSQLKVSSERTLATCCRCSSMRLSGVTCSAALLTLCTSW